MIKRATVTNDLHQESHLFTMGAVWSRKGYIFLALFTGYLSVMVYFQRITIIDIPLLGWVGYSFFQIMTAGTFALSLYFALWSKKKGEIEQSPVSFSWLGFWLRDFFMAAVFFPFFIIIQRILFSGEGKGLFIDLGAWDGLMNSSTPLGKRIVLGLIGLIIIGAILVFLYIPVLLFWRSIVSLSVHLKKGNTVATFDADSYVSGETVTVKIKTEAKEKLSTSKRVFVNLIQRNANQQHPPSKKDYQRVYLYSEFEDVTSETLNSGVSFVLPISVPGGQPTSAHLDKEMIQYWEILVEEPGKLYWARFLFLVE